MADKKQALNVNAIVAEYINSGDAWRMKLAKMHPHIHFGELAAQMLTDKGKAAAVAQEYLAILENINEELQKPDRADLHKDVSVSVATELDGIRGSAEVKLTDSQTALSRMIAGTAVVSGNG